MLELRNLVSRVEDLRMMVGRIQTDQSERKTGHQDDKDPHFQYVTQAGRVAQIHEGWQNKRNQIVCKEAALARLDGFDHSRKKEGWLHCLHDSDFDKWLLPFHKLSDEYERIHNRSVYPGSKALECSLDFRVR